MAKIVEYNAPTEDTNLRPNEIGAEALARSGRIIEAQGDRAGAELGSAVAGLGQVGEMAVRHAEQMQTTQSAADFAVKSDQINTYVQKSLAAADPNHLPEARLAILDSYVKPMMQDWIDGAGSTAEDRKYRTGQVDRFTQYMTEHTGAQVVRAAGDTMAVNIGKIKDASSAATANDPGSVDFHLNEVKLGIADTADRATRDSGVSFDDAQKAKTELTLAAQKKVVSSAFYGIAKNQGSAAAEAFARNPKYAPFMDGDEVTRYITMARNTERSLAVAGRSLMLSENRQAADMANNAFVAKLYAPDTTAEDVMKMLPEALEAASHPGNGPNQAETNARIVMTRAAELNNGKTVIDNPSVRGGFENQVGTPDFNPRAAYLEIGRGLSQETYNRMMKDHGTIMSDPNMVEQVKAANLLVEGYKSAYEASIPGIKFATAPENDVAFSLFQARVRPLMNAAIRAGKPMDAAALSQLVNVKGDQATARQYIRGGAPPTVPFGQAPPGGTAGQGYMAGTQSFSDFIKGQPPQAASYDWTAAYAAYLHSRGQR